MIAEYFIYYYEYQGIKADIESSIIMSNIF